MATARLLLAFAAVWALSSIAQTPAPTRPVIFIPGILGSKLCERASNKVIWGDRWSLSRFTELGLPVQYDPSKLPHVPCGPIEVVNVVGPLQIHQYDDLFQTFKGMGYEPNKTLFVFDYDWRLSNRTNAARLEEFMKETVKARPVDIVAHSMGGLVAKLWMAEHAGADRVSTLVTMGTPYQGSASTFKAIDEGWGTWANLVMGGLPGIRETLLSFPSIYELLPAYAGCCHVAPRAGPAPGSFDPFAPADWEKTPWLPASFKTPERKAWLGETLSKARTAAQTKVPINTRLIPIVNGLIPTAWRVVLRSSDRKLAGFVMRPGDGTVYQTSAANGDLSNARPALTSHQTIFADDAARQTIRWVLSDGPEPTKGVLPTVRAKLTTADHKTVDLAAASAEVVPAVLKPEQEAEFVVVLEGSADLLTANLSNVAAFLDKAGSLGAPVVKPAEATANGTAVQLTFKLRAPKEPGAFMVTADIPSVASLPDIALVVPQ